MKELDFDELDRAVNSLVTQTKKYDQDNTSTGKQPQKQEGIAQTESSQNSVVQNTSSPDKKNTPVLHHTVSKTTPSVIPPRRNRLGVKSQTLPTRTNIVDIVPPKPKQSNVSRTGIALQPAGKPSGMKPEPPTPSDATPEVPEAKSQTKEADVQPAVEKTTVPDETSQGEKTEKNDEHWPDPLDFHKTEFKHPPAKEDANDEAKPTVAEEPSSPMAEPQSWQQPVPETPNTSPFLPGTKVEKRPLGGYTPPKPAQDEEPAPSLTPEPDHTSTRESEPSELPESKPPATPAPTQMPDELQPEVLAAESHEPEAKVDQSLITESSDAARPELETVDEKTPADQQVRDSAMLSIPQQYRTATKEINDTPRPVFDTNEYHPPLLESTAHGAHQGDFWMKLLITLLVASVLAIGAFLLFIYFV